MRYRMLTWTGAAAACAVVSLAVPTVAGQSQTSAKPGAAAQASAPKTAWGDPDLQGIWNDEFQTPLQRPASFAGRELLTDAERAEIDQRSASLLRRDKRVERGTELDVAGAYNAVFQSVRYAGRRTSLIVDPPDGKIPALTEAAQKAAAADRSFRLALLQSTETCKNKSIACNGGQYDPAPSPRRADAAPRYNTARMNRHDGPEDGSLADRCMSATLPDFGGFKRIVQTPGGVTMFYDTGQGQGWQRDIVMTGAPHLPAAIRQWHGDSRGRWEGNSLVVDVTNFSPKSNYQGAHESLHLVERWTRLDADTLEYAVTIEDPATWTKPWTVKQELTKQNDQANRIYYEPRCHEGNMGFPALLLAARLEELAFTEGRGPDPATKDNATDFVGVEE